MLRSLILLSFSLGAVFPLYATHIRGGDIRIGAVDCERHIYKIIVTGYVDLGSGVPFGSGALHFGDGEKIDTLEGSADFIGWEELGNELAVVQFEVIHTYPGPGEYTASYLENNRNARVVNMSNSLTTPFFIETSFVINPHLGCNNTPELKLPPADLAYVRQRFTHNPGAIDPDGDSLSYQIVANKQDIDFDVDNYAFPNDPRFGGSREGSELPADYFIDSQGTVVWNAPGMAGEYNLAFVIEEWRAIGPGEWRRVGRTMRDMQAVVEEEGPQRPEILMPDEITVEKGGLVELPIELIVAEADSTAVTVVSPLLENEKFDAGFYYDEAAKKGFFYSSFRCAPLGEKIYPVTVKAESSYMYGTAVNYKTVNIKVQDSKHGNMRLDFQEEAIEISWDNTDMEGLGNLGLWKHHGKTYSPPSVCIDGSLSDQGFQKIAELPPGVDHYVDSDLVNPGEDYAGEYCYSLVATDEKGDETLLTSNCVSNPWAEIPRVDEIAVVIPTKIFPNPVSGQLTVLLPEVQEKVYIRVVDKAGRTVYAHEFKNARKMYIPFAGVVHGLYYLQLESADYKIQRRLVKKGF